MLSLINKWGRLRKNEYFPYAKSEDSDQTAYMRSLFRLPDLRQIVYKRPLFCMNHEDSGRTVKRMPVGINVAEIWKVVDFSRNGITNWE